ncbi:bifunctional Zinc finger [Babesia duncani]|uniref:Bifunctional Zinc finger n=1 Tax=Babesia duncani TaxID=323732 RepID=A0AAD9PIZ0_9APIC|nr:bifunctional Zinc finger [Babesia duncani]
MGHCIANPWLYDQFFNENSISSVSESLNEPVHQNSLDTCDSINILNNLDKSFPESILTKQLNEKISLNNNESYLLQGGASSFGKVHENQYPNFGLDKEEHESYWDEKEWDMLIEKLAATNTCTNISSSSGSNKNEVENSWSRNLFDYGTDPLSMLTTASGSLTGSDLARKTDVQMPRDAKYGFRRTSICKYWQRGICVNKNCNFAHGKDELQSTIGVWKTTICHYWKSGNCRIGAKCRHAHGEEELQPKNIPAHVLKNKLLHSSRRKERTKANRS